MPFETEMMDGSSLFVRNIKYQLLKTKLGFTTDVHFTAWLLDVAESYYTLQESQKHRREDEQSTAIKYHPPQLPMKEPFSLHNPMGLPMNMNTNPLLTVPSLGTNSGKNMLTSSLGPIVTTPLMQDVSSLRDLINRGYPVDATPKVSIPGAELKVETMNVEERNALQQTPTSDAGASDGSGRRRKSKRPCQIKPEKVDVGDDVSSECNSPLSLVVREQAGVSNRSFNEMPTDISRHNDSGSLLLDDDDLSSSDILSHSDYDPVGEDLPSNDPSRINLPLLYPPLLTPAPTIINNLPMEMDFDEVERSDDIHSPNIPPGLCLDDTLPIPSPRSCKSNRSCGSSGGCIINGQTKFPCRECGDCFPSNYKLLVHKQQHTGEWPRCPVCQQPFRSKYSLTNHMRIHTGEKPFICRYCQKAFNVKSNMYKHIRINHAREAPFNCAVCNKQMGDLNLLRKHLKLVHKLVVEPGTEAQLCATPDAAAAAAAVTSANLESEAILTMDNLATPL